MTTSNYCVLPFLRCDRMRVSEAIDPTSLSKNDTENRKKRMTALEILGMWKTRRGEDNIPFAADITELLLRAKIYEMDFISKEGVNWWNRPNAHALISMAILRFVNFIQDSLGHKIAAQSFRDPRVMESLPPTILDIRNRIAHKKMPPLHEQVAALDKCLPWLWEQYWSHPWDDHFDNFLSQPTGEWEDTNNYNNNNNQNDDKEIIETVRKLMDKFEMVRNEYFFANIQRSKQMMKEEKNTLNNITQLFTTNPELVLRVLVAEGHLLFNSSQLESSGWLREENNTLGPPPRSVQLFWQPILNAIVQQQCILKLVECFVSQPIETTSLKCWQLSSWLCLVLDATEICVEEQLINDQNIANRVFLSALHRPTHFQWNLLFRLSNCLRPLLSKEKLNSLKEMHAIYGTWPESDESNISASNHQIYTVDDVESSPVEVQEDQSVQVLDEPLAQEDIGGGWTKLNCDWSSIPIGLLPGQSANTLDLVLNNK